MSLYFLYHLTSVLNLYILYIHLTLTISEILTEMAEYSVKFPSNEEIQPHKIPDITQLMEALLAAVSGIANEGYLDAHECEGKCV